VLLVVVVDFKVMGTTLRHGLRVVHRVDVTTAGVTSFVDVHTSALLVTAFFFKFIGFTLVGGVLIMLIRIIIIVKLIISKLNFILFEFFLNKLLSITKLRELYLLLFYYKCWKFPLPPFIIPISFFFDFVELFIIK